MTTATAENRLVAPRQKRKSGMLTAGLMVVVGLEKSGKSALIASAPDSYILELDPGDADHLDGRIQDIVPEVDEAGNIVNSALNVFRRSYKAALADATIKVIGVDTFNTFVKLQGQEIAEAAGLKSMTDRKEGVNGYALWEELDSRVCAFIESAKCSGKLVVVTAHCKSPELDEDKRVVIPIGIDSYRKPGSILAKRADLIGYSYKKEVGEVQEYRLSFRGGPLGAWGSRVDSLNDKTIRLAKNDPWGSLVAAAEGKATPTTTASSNGEKAKDKTKGRK